MSRKSTTSRKISEASPRVGLPARGKAVAIRTKRDSDQSLKRIQKEAVNQALYGRPLEDLLDVVTAAFRSAKN